MILSAHNFRGHVAWSAGRILSVILSPDASNSKVGDTHIAIGFYDKILRLDVSVNNIFIMDVLQPCY